MLVSCSLRIHANKHGFKASKFLQKYKDLLCRLDISSLSCIFLSVGFSKTLFFEKQYQPSQMHQVISLSLLAQVAMLSLLVRI